MEEEILPQWVKGPKPTTASGAYCKLVFRTRKRLVFALGCMASICILFWVHQADVVQTISQSVPVKMQSDTINHVYNRTLGFQKVYTIGFESRTDKHDARTLASSVTGFDIDWIPGVSFEDISTKAAPATWSYDVQSKGALGCWRAHMNAVEKIVAEGIQTALVFEDDGDWDVSLKDQLFELANGARALQGVDSSKGSSIWSPYGNDWDLLWLGHCRIGTNDLEQKFWIIDDDFTVPPPAHRHSRWRNIHYPEFTRRNNTRVMFRANAGACTAAYALTYEGARKMLSSLSLQSRDLPIDISMSALCREAFAKPYRCYAPYPPLVSGHKAAGPSSRDSDLNNKGSTWHEAFTWDIVYSATMNVPNLVEGKETINAQWSDVEFPEMPWKEHARPLLKGHIETIKVFEQSKNDTMKVGTGS